MISTLSISRAWHGRGAFTAMAALATLLVLSGCGDKNKDKTATQTAARVNKEEITVHQINYVLAQRAVPPAQAASASKLVLERLIDQELARQKAAEQRLDRDPRVVQQLEAARREIIARAYLEKIAAGAPKPTPAEIKAYYDANPALFKDRRIYTLQEIDIQAPADQIDGLRAKLQGAKDLNQFIEYLKANNVKAAVTQVVRPAEQIPLAALPTLAQMKDGQTVFEKSPSGARIVHLAGSRSQPVTEEQARPAIEQFLLHERQRKVVDDDLKALRSAAKIEYVGDYAKNPADRAAAEKAELETSASVSPLTAASGASAPELVAPPPPPSSPLVGTPAASAPEPIVPVKPASVPTGSSLDRAVKGLR